MSAISAPVLLRVVCSMRFAVVPAKRNKLVEVEEHMLAAADISDR